MALNQEVADYLSCRFLSPPSCSSHMGTLPEITGMMADFRIDFSNHLKGVKKSLMHPQHVLVLKSVALK